MSISKEEAIKEQQKLSLADIALSLENYSENRENSSTRNYFEHQNVKYPIMNIIKEAIIISNNKNKSNHINLKGYDNLKVCIQTLKYHLENNKVQIL